MNHLAPLSDTPPDTQEQFCLWLLHGGLFAGPKQLLQAVNERFKAKAAAAAAGGSGWPSSAVLYLLPGALQLVFDVAVKRQGEGEPGVAMERDIEVCKNIIMVYFKHAVGLQQQQGGWRVGGLGSTAAAAGRGGVTGGPPAAAAAAGRRGGGGGTALHQVQQLYLAADHLVRRCCCVFSEHGQNLSGLMEELLTEKLHQAPPAAGYWAAGAVQGLGCEQLKRHYLRGVRESVRERVRDVESAGGVLDLLLGGKEAAGVTPAIGGRVAAAAAVSVHRESIAESEASPACAVHPSDSGDSISQEAALPSLVAATADVCCSIAVDVLGALLSRLMEPALAEGGEVWEGPVMSAILKSSRSWCEVMRVCGRLDQGEGPLQQHQLVKAVAAAVATYDRKLAQGELTMQELLDGLAEGHSSGNYSSTSASNINGGSSSTRAFFLLLHEVQWALPAAPASTPEVLNHWQQLTLQLQQETELLQLFYSTTCTSLFAAGDVGECLGALGEKVGELAGRMMGDLQQEGAWGELQGHLVAAELLVPLSESYTFRAAVELYKEQHEPGVSAAGAAGAAEGDGVVGGGGSSSTPAAAASGGAGAEAAAGASRAAAHMITVSQVVCLSAELVSFFRALWEPYYDPKVQLSIRKVRQLWGSCPATALAVEGEFKLVEQQLGVGGGPAAAAGAAGTGPEVVEVFLDVVTFLGAAGGKSISEQLQDVGAIFKLLPR